MDNMDPWPFLITATISFCPASRVKIRHSAEDERRKRVNSPKENPGSLIAFVRWDSTLWEEAQWEWILRGRRQWGTTLRAIFSVKKDGPSQRE